MVSLDVRAEKVRTLYRQTVPVLLTNVVNSTIVSVALWTLAPRKLLLSWVGLMGVMASARWLLFKRYQRAAPLPEVAASWGARFVAGSAAAGILWGGAGFLLLEHGGVLPQLLITFVIGGMCAAAAGTLAWHLPAYIVFTVPALSALAARMALFGDSIHWAMALLIVVYGAGLTAVANITHRALTESLALRFENTELLDRLSLTRSELEDANRTLEQRVIERSEALKKQTEALRDAQRLEAIGRLAGGVAHDFNNLLTVILANLSEPQTRLPSGEMSKGALDEIRDAATRGADLVRQLLAFSRRQHSKPEILDLNRIVATMSKLLDRLLGEQINLELILQDTPLYVHVDPTQIEQVLVNLAANARDAIENGGTVTIETQSLQLTEPRDGIDAGKYAVLLVRDTGHGMDSETRMRVFEPFFTTKDVGKGTGLGLATVYGIVEQSGGHVRIDSSPKKGSCFCVYLPPAAPASRIASLDEGPAYGSLNPRAEVSASPVTTILLVEDDPSVRAVARRILEREGHLVLVAECGEQALRVSAAHEGPIELLLTDVVMPGIGGPSLAERLRSLRPGIRTLFVSGYSRSFAIPESDPAGGVGFLAKPFTRDSLIAKIHELVVSTRTDN